MLAWLTSLLFLATTINGSVRVSREEAVSRSQDDAVLGLLQRLLGHRAAEFRVHVMLDGLPGERDVVSISTATDPVTNLTIVTADASTGVAAAWGVHHYLKYHCHAHVSWEVNQLMLSTPLPEANFTLEANDKFRYHENVCTPGYSYAWWQWPDWEQHIDWMALNGINLPLAFTGQEAIWQTVYLQLGLTQADLDAFFAGPAFLPWGRMGNLKAWGGPLSNSWHKMQVGLQKQIVGRMRSLGMKPVLPAFAGQVPDKMTELFPSSNFTRLPNWNYFNNTYSGVMLLDPTDPLFQRIGDLFMEEQIKEFGTDHYYNCDTFNEMRPATNSTSYLSSIGKATMSAMTNTDPEAVWIMQGWLFLDSSFWGSAQVEALLTSVPLGKMIVLDLDSIEFEQYTRTQSYFGQPFIFSMLNNFGGTQALYGKAMNVDSLPFEARTMPNSSMVGTGLTMEAIHNSYVMYDLMNEMSWRTEPVDVPEWFSEYAARRYGSNDSDASSAWKMLAGTVYNSTGGTYHQSVLLVGPPELGMKDVRWYSLSSLLMAWQLMVAASARLGDVPTFSYDLVDITRQVFVNFAPHWYNQTCLAYQQKNVTLIHDNAEVFKDLLLDLDRVLGTNSNFMLGQWLEAAKGLATNEDEAILYEFNARNQITLWGPDANILDYASKQWNGMIADYYLPRWSLFYKGLEKAAMNSTNFDQSKYFSEWLETLGKPFNKDRKVYPADPVENTQEVVLEVFYKWWKPFLAVALAEGKNSTNIEKKSLRKLRPRKFTQNANSIYSL